MSDYAMYKYAKIIQIVVGTPDGRVILRKEIKPSEYSVEWFEYMQWDMSLRAIHVSMSSEDTVSRFLRNSFGLITNKYNMESLGKFSPAGDSTVGEVFCVEISSKTPIQFKNLSRNIIAVPFPDVVKAVKIRPERFSANTALAINVINNRDVIDTKAKEISKSINGSFY